MGGPVLLWKRSYPGDLSKNNRGNIRHWLIAALSEGLSLLS